jgi:hypothetical protein
MPDTRNAMHGSQKQTETWIAQNEAKGQMGFITCGSKVKNKIFADFAPR